MRPAGIHYDPEFQAALRNLRPEDLEPRVVLDSAANVTAEDEGCDQETEYGFANPHGNRKQRRAWASQQRRKR